MPIVVNHSPSAAIIGQAAIAGGQGELQRYLDKQRREEEAQALQLEAQRQRQLETILAQQQEAEAARQAQAERDQFQADQQRQRDEWQADQKNQDYDRTRKDYLTDYGTKRSDEQSDYERNRTNTLEDWTKRQDYETKQLTTKNQARVDAIKQSIVDAQNSGAWDDEAMKELRRRADLEIMNIHQDAYSFKPPKTDFEPTVKEINGVTFVQTSPGQWTQSKDPKAEKDPFAEDKQADIRAKVYKRADDIFQQSKKKDELGVETYTKTYEEAQQEAMKQLYPNGRFPWETEADVASKRPEGWSKSIWDVVKQEMDAARNSGVTDPKQLDEIGFAAAKKAMTNPAAARSDAPTSAPAMQAAPQTPTIQQDVRQRAKDAIKQAIMSGVKDPQQLRQIAAQAMGGAR
jgi:hypothetical protein